MITVIVISAAAHRLAEMELPRSYEAFADAIGTYRFEMRVLDGGDSLFFPEEISESTGTFEIDHCTFNAPAIIFRQGEYSVPEGPRMSLEEAKRRVSHLTAVWDGYESEQIQEGNS